jgi:hypothetical protein
MPDFRPDILTRLLQLERELSALKSRSIDLPDRPALLGHGRQPRLAKTVAGGETYPSEGANVYWIKFIDGDYTESPGHQTLTATERQATAIAKVFNLSERYIPENTVVPVFWDRGHWWTWIDRPGKARWIAFTVGTGGLATTQASKSVAIDAFWDGSDPGSPLTVYNMEASAQYVFSGGSTHKGYACYDPESDIYRIVQMECP